MCDLADELLQIADRLKSLSANGSDPEITQPLQKVEEVLQTFSQSASGSWLGYHANVYYENFRIPPPGTRFSVEWGLMRSYSGGTRGDWREYPVDAVRAEIW